MVARFFVVGLLLVGCGGDAGADGQAQGLNGMGGTDALGGASAAQAGAAGAVSSAAGSSASAGQGGRQEPTAGAGGASPGSAGETSKAGGAGGPQGGTTAGTGAGTAGGGGTSHGGSSAGAGGKAGGDPLEPVPVPGCAGYVKVLVPKGTCVWFHGTHSIQTESCSLADPPEGKCSTASAVSKDLTSIVSDGAIIERFDLETGACPKTCQ